MKLVALLPAVVLAISSVSHAATIAAASITVPSIGTDTCCLMRQNFSFDYSLLVTGGTGTGVAMLDAVLQGTTNETPYPAPWDFGGDVDLTIQIAGNQVARYWLPFEGCGGFSNPPCIVPFTFGVPETLHFSGFARAWFTAPAGTDLTELRGGTITASVQFSGIRGILNGTGHEIIQGYFVADPTAAVPEPSLFWALLLVLGSLARRME